MASRHPQSENNEGSGIAGDGAGAAEPFESFGEVNRNSILVKCLSPALGDVDNTKSRRGLVMKPSIYLETSVIGCLAMRLSGVLRIAANQQVTREWWDNHRQRFDLFVSRYVIDECSRGDPQAAQERMAFLDGIPLLEVSDSVETLARALLTHVPLPAKASVDALHISVAALSGVEFLLTWNCKHIANPSLRLRIESVCRGMGCEPPVICTPQELLEINDAT